VNAPYGDFGGEVLWFNLTRQLAWRTVPRIGKPLTLELHGPPRAAWVLALSPSIANLALPPLGVLRLDPQRLFVAGSGVLTPQGSGSLTWQVPAVPGLVGLAVHWQAVIGPPYELTNFETTTLTNL
jgi:hypothetical protein